jgi:hypothetical protein
MNSNNRNRRWAGGVGMAIGAALAAALAATPGVASADSSTDPFSWIGGMDLGGLSIPAQTSALDMQVSIDGTDLFPTAGNTAFAHSGPLDIAIAIGNGADANAGFSLFFNFGLGDFAFADGANSLAEAGNGTGWFDSAILIGADSSAIAGPGVFDLAAVFGDMLHASATANFMADIVP